MRKNSFGLYGITKRTGKYEHDFNPDPENTPLFRVIFWSLVISVTGAFIVSAYYGLIIDLIRWLK